MKGLVLDWGGVLTNGIDAAFADWASRDGVLAEHLGLVLREAFASGGEQHNPVHALECGEIDAAQFESQLASELARHGSPVPAAGLLARMFAGIAPSDSMLGLVARAKEAGLRTAVLWVAGDNPAAIRTYRRAGFERAALDVRYSRRPVHISGSPDGATMGS